MKISLSLSKILFLFILFIQKILKVLHFLQQSKYTSEYNFKRLNVLKFVFISLISTLCIEVRNAIFNFDKSLYFKQTTNRSFFFFNKFSNKIVYVVRHFNRLTGI